MSNEVTFVILEFSSRTWSISYAGVQQLLGEDNSTYYDSDIGSDLVDVGEDIDISIPTVRLGDEEEHIVETDQSIWEAIRKDVVLDGESDVERKEDGDETQDLIADSQEEQFLPSTSARAVSQMPRKNKRGCGGIFQCSLILTSRMGING